MKKKQKAALVTAMLMMFSSCSPNENTPNPVTGTVENTQSGEESNYDIIVYDIPQKETEYLITSLDEINKRLGELGKDYRVEFRVRGDRENIEKIASSGEADIVTSTALEDSKEMGKNGLLLEISDYLASEKGKPLYESITENMWYAQSFNKKIYGVTGYMYAGSAPPCYYVNRELMEKYNLTEEDFKCSISELENILETVKNGEGEDFHPLKVMLPAGGFVLSYAESLTEAVGINIKTGKAELYIDNEDYMSIMGNIYDLNRKGYVFIEKYSETKENYLVSFDFIGSQLAPAANDEKTDNIPGFTEEDLLAVTWEDINDNGYGYYCMRTFPAVCVSAASKNQERALDLITAIYTDKALSDLFIYGVEDVDYTLDENGRVVKRDFNYLTMLYFGNSLIATDFCDAPKAYNIDKQNKMQKNPYLDFEVTDSSVEGGIDDSSMTLIYDGIEETKDFDEVIAQVRTELNESGAEQYIEGINKSLEEYMKGRE